MIRTMAGATIAALAVAGLATTAAARRYQPPSTPLPIAATTGVPSRSPSVGVTVQPMVSPLSNAALVRKTVELCEKYERPVATWSQARDILGLKVKAAA